MAKIIRSSDAGWLDVSDIFYNNMHPDILAERLSDAVDNINKAKDCLSNADGLNSFSFSLTTEDTEELVANLRKFVYFSNGIHYEISEMVDTPFSIKMGNLASDAIDLNPSDYRYVKSKFLCFKNYMTLADLVLSTMDDNELKLSFREKAMALDEDTESFELQDSIKEANWWQAEFILAEEIDKATDEFFTPEVKAKWPSMTPEERDKYIQEYQQILDKIYFDGELRVPNTVEYLVVTKDKNGNDVEPGYGVAYGSPTNSIGVNYNFRDNPTGMHSVDKLIDTMTHEMRHRYQALNTSEMPNSIREEWNQDYMPSYIEGDPDPVSTYDKYYRQPVEEDAKAFAALAQDDED